MSDLDKATAFFVRDRAASFSNPASVASYTEGATRMVPGLRDLHRMAGVLLAERIGEQKRILVLGAGGGMELAAFAEAYPDWSFDGVDPSKEMLILAKQTLGSKTQSVRFHQGTIDIAPEGPFDGATCLLTLHFLPREERLRTLIEVRRRLAPGAAFVVAHHSFSQNPEEKERWLGRFAAYAAGSGMSIDQAHNAAAGIGARLPVMSPHDDEALFREAGFTAIELFYAALTFRGWVASA